MRSGRDSHTAGAMFPHELDPVGVLVALTTVLIYRLVRDR
jgi:hypothetical protein